MECRPDCGACCVVPSISSPIPGMPNGKPAFAPCVHFDTFSRVCGIWMNADYPDVCLEFNTTLEYCGGSREEAIRLLARLEKLTAP